MSDIEKPHDEIEVEPAPIISSGFQEYSDCAYLCFYIDPQIYDRENFKITSSIISSLSFKDFKLENNLVVFFVYLEGLLNYALSIFKSMTFWEASVSHALLWFLISKDILLS